MMRSFTHNNPLSLVVLTALLLPPRTIAIGISFTSPGAGASWPAGPITVTWSDAGGSPNMSQLSTYNLQLIVGGNNPRNSDVIATLGVEDGNVADGSIEDEIAADVAQSVENGFYFRMTSNTSNGNQVINYSSRFTLINLNGTTDSKYLDGANAAAGSRDVPEAVYNITNGPSDDTTSPSSASSSTSPDTATATATETNTPDTEDAFMSTGTRVAISVGSVLALVGLISLFYWAWILFRHKKRKQQQQQGQSKSFADSTRASRFGKSPFLDGKAELAASHTSLTPQSTFPLELSPTEERYEVSGTRGMVKPVEAGRASIYELEGEWSGWEAGSGRKSKAYDPTAM